MKRVLQLQKYTSLQYSAHLGLLQRTRLPGSASWALTESAIANAAQFPCGSVTNQSKSSGSQNVAAHGLLSIQKTDHEVRQERLATK